MGSEGLSILPTASGNGKKSCLWVLSTFVSQHRGVARVWKEMLRGNSSLITVRDLLVKRSDLKVIPKEMFARRCFCGKLVFRGFEMETPRVIRGVTSAKVGGVPAITSPHVPGGHGANVSGGVPCDFRPFRPHANVIPCYTDRSVASFKLSEWDEYRRIALIGEEAEQMAKDIFNCYLSSHGQPGLIAPRRCIRKPPTPCRMQEMLTAHLSKLS